MRVLHVIPSVSAVHGGPSFALQSMTRSLAKSGVEVHVATTDDDGAGRMDVPLGRPVCCQAVTSWYFPRQTSFYKFSWPLTTWLARHLGDYDLVHIHALFSYASFPASVIATRRGVPYILRPLGTLNRWGMQNRHRMVKRVSFPMIESKIIARASLMHYTSEDERVEAQELGVDRPFAIIPIGLDLAGTSTVRSKDWLQSRAPHLAERKTILFLSRIDRKKGLELLLQAFARLKSNRSDIGLVVAGDGESQYVSKLKSQANRLGIDCDVFWAGHIRGDEKRGAFEAADIFALPSHSENFGVAVVEAMAAGLPVLISGAVGIHREVNAAGAGRVVPYETGALADALGLLCGDTAMCREMGAAGQRLVEERYSSSAMAAQLVAAYTILVEARKTLKQSAIGNPLRA